jgi:RNA exonuclease NGL2
MKSHDWDIAAFQEMDKIEVHGPNMTSSSRGYVYEKGYSAKQHGLMIAWRFRGGNADRVVFDEKAAGSKVVYYDQECIGPKGENRKGLSRVTRNIALFVALSSTGDSSKGVIVATTHLFWHPFHSAERVRQSGILKRTLLEWRQEKSEWKDWPIILAGDFNDQPHSATYKLMTGEPLTRHNWEEIKSSSVIHKSVDELKEREASVKGEKGAASAELTEEGEAIEGDEEDGEEGGEEEEEEGEDNPMPKNCRHALSADGLLSFSELVQLHDLTSPLPQHNADETARDGKELIGCQAERGLTSAYGSYYGSLETDQEGNYFGSSSRGRERFDDPHWTADSPNPHLGASKE